jgi:hypothetical protein
LVSKTASIYKKSGLQANKVSFFSFFRGFALQIPGKKRKNKIIFVSPTPQAW